MGEECIYSPRNPQIIGHRQGLPGSGVAPPLHGGRPTLLPIKAIRIFDLAPALPESSSSSYVSDESDEATSEEMTNQWDGQWDYGVQREDEIARWFVGVTELLNTQPFRRNWLVEAEGG